MATPVLTHALEQFPTSSPAGRTASRRIGRLRSGLLIGATAALTVTVLPGTAAAVPDRATSPEQAMQLASAADHELEVVTEQLNEAKVALETQQAAAAAAQQAAAEAQSQLDALDGQIRMLARTVYTGDSLSELDMMLTSDSAEEFVSQLGTLDAIAGHTNDLVTEIGHVSEKAVTAQAAADKATAEAQAAVDSIAAQQAELQEKVEDYQRQYAALTAPQQEEVSRAHAGEAMAAPSGVIAPSQAAQVAVDTALAQVGDPYVWGAGGPNAFDCSGLTQYAYSAAGVSLPHSSRSQAGMGQAVSRDQLQPGDLLFYYSPTSHVAMYIGNGQMVHASTSSKPVMVASFNSMSGFTHARRVAG
ncbi:NlpC/P60 family protein [Blastococcus sp. CT_GayMR19]|uniref:C40 family peptidase n=1 Tax=Blastococcus sp. CT_GayMR19 TaxID=2559608 RepID=UPI001073CE3A|nr:C40 family peptidase [Blastococcus sp. CT_GayMR19]TFV79136.1 NlpC/P60 family protein [Blastococcus sp. CT_GayMR19]